MHLRATFLVNCWQTLLAPTSTTRVQLRTVVSLLVNKKPARQRFSVVLVPRRERTPSPAAPPQVQAFIEQESPEKKSRRRKAASRHRRFQRNQQISAERVRRDLRDRCKQDVALCNTIINRELKLQATQDRFCVLSTKATNKKTNGYENQQNDVELRKARLRESCRQELSPRYHRLYGTCSSNASMSAMWPFRQIPGGRPAFHPTQLAAEQTSLL
ncbi:hypothetical protein FPOAC2_13195 [Fusarium poae]